MTGRFRILALFLCLWVLFLPVASSAQNTERTSGVGFYFDTVVTVTLYGAPEGLMDIIWQDCAFYEHMLSKTVDGSDVDRINHSAGEPVKVSEETFEILKRAKEISQETDGAFSITIAPLTALWDFTGGTERMPTDEERLEKLPLVNDSLLRLEEGCMVTLPAGMEIDLGGIAKGYIADQIAAHIRDQVLGAILNFGGNVYVVGQKPDGSPFRVGIRDPLGPEGSSCAVVSVADISVVTSGIYERYFIRDNVRYHHILDPKTGSSAQTDLASATIVSESSMTADAMATACIVMGSEQALSYLSRCGADAVLILRDGTFLSTEGFEEKCGFQPLP